MIPYGKQLIDTSDITAVIEVLQSDWLTQGPAIPAFEQAIAKYCKADYAVAVNSATSALHIACLALDIGPGDRVWTSPNSFVASANCALYCGASIDFIDIELETGNISVSALETKLKQAQRQNQLPKLVIPVHFAGQSCDMQAIAALAKQYGFKILEDASHAIGARYQNEPVGNCHYSDICVFSFHPVKIITTGEGGIATTQNPVLARKMQMLRSHGITADETEFSEPSHGVWYYQQQLLGFNYRLTDMQAALGLSQLKKLESLITARHKLVESYNQSFADHPFFSPLMQCQNTYSSFHLYVIRLINQTQLQHKECIRYLRQQGIVGHLHYIPIYLQPYYQALGFKSGYCPNAEDYYHQAITLPLYPGLTAEQQTTIVNTLERYFCHGK